jgi:hypothetical protein
MCIGSHELVHAGICLAVRREAFEAKEAAAAYLLPYAAAPGPRRRRHRKPQQGR